jgi:hypothetical protein
MFEQDRFVVRLRQRLLTEPTLQAAWLGGSFGRSREDDFSDIDICLVYADDASRDAAWQTRVTFCRSILAYVPAKSFDAVHIRPYLHCALYSNGAKADFRFESMTTLTPNPWDGEIKLLKDRDDGWAAAHQNASRRLALPRPHISGDELRALDERFWVMFWDVFRQVRRGTPGKPFVEYLRMLALTLPPLLDMLPAEDDAREKLIDLDYTLAAGTTLTHLRQLFEAYLAARGTLVQRHQIPFVPDGAFERQISRLLQR